MAFAGSATSFAALAQRKRHPVPVFYYGFDLLWLEGRDVRALPLRVRKRLLRAALTFKDPVRLMSHRNESGEQLYEQACRRGWEGLIAKRADSPYASTRSPDWLKFKCERGQELVIGGYTAPQGSRREFGALLLGYYDDGQLRYAGKVGTGFDHTMLREIGSADACATRGSSACAMTSRPRMWSARDDRRLAYMRHGINTLPEPADPTCAADACVVLPLPFAGWRQRSRVRPADRLRDRGTASDCSLSRLRRFGACWSACRRSRQTSPGSSVAPSCPRRT